jgi:hypothetical protein
MPLIPVPGISLLSGVAGIVPLTLVPALVAGGMLPFMSMPGMFGSMVGCGMAVGCTLAGLAVAAGCAAGTLADALLHAATTIVNPMVRTTIFRYFMI